ncbi:MAG: GIY-YIG nuclease family protein [Rhodospirillaceae bacterium]|nr:GIY-YIG nuclease family protein [Rhodospirillaceae bacterium]
MRYSHVYILGSLSHTLNVGVTGDLARRMHEHRCGSAEGFARRYNISKLLWCEPHERILEAIAREKQIKRWRRAKKIALIERDNPGFRDLWPQLKR